MHITTPFDLSPANSFGRRRPPDEAIEAEIANLVELAGRLDDAGYAARLRAIAYRIAVAKDDMEPKPGFRPALTCRERQGRVRRTLRRAFAWVLP